MTHTLELKLSIGKTNGERSGPSILNMCRVSQHEGFFEESIQKFGEKREPGSKVIMLAIYIEIVTYQNPAWVTPHLQWGNYGCVDM
jgi:hypothetical protein